MDQGDQWAEIAGDRRWSWEGMLSYFKANETFIPSATQKSLQEENEDLHGTDGPIMVSHPSNSGKPRDYPLRQDMARFHQALGAKLIPENNAGSAIGYTEAAQSNYDGQRQFAAKAYPFGPNVTVWAESETKNRGSVKLNSSDPADSPVVDPALLASPTDKEILYAAVCSTMTAMKNLEGLDAVEYTIDEALRHGLSDDAVAAG
ncbi:GMC-OxRdtase-N domain-containing protein [Fusarium falciforme]|uniref:GMC-OxRdtase-N domain-containing protein n=1 Tax=Fusarium falciforme TaxID=195108 RepID=UPI002301841B|nr:GMC-OxRdtase-N domain-containing protein [Fusarium falciforme]WAO89836.1 GMC-OxRdtase-N domain-containing protein [Fusarium falciforme]